MDHDVIRTGLGTAILVGLNILQRESFGHTAMDAITFGLVDLGVKKATSKISPYTTEPFATSYLYSYVAHFRSTEEDQRSPFVDMASGLISSFGGTVLHDKLMGR